MDGQAIERDVQWTLDELFRQSADDLHRYLLGRTNDPDLAADLVSETFLRAVRHHDQMDRTRGSARQWLFGIARNLLRDHWRRRQVELRARRRLATQSPVDDVSPTPFESVETVSLRASLVDALNDLNQPYRSAVALRIIDGASYDRIGRQLGCTPGAARVRVHRGLQRLDVALRPAELN